MKNSSILYLVIILSFSPAVKAEDVKACLEDVRSCIAFAQDTISEDPKRAIKLFDTITYVLKGESPTTQNNRLKQAVECGLEVIQVNFWINRLNNLAVFTPTEKQIVIGQARDSVSNWLNNNSKEKCNPLANQRFSSLYLEIREQSNVLLSTLLK